MAVDDRELKRGFRNAWILTLLGALYVVTFFYFAWTKNSPAPPRTWEMGGTPFVPASSPHAEGYYTEPLAPPQRGGQR